MLSKKALTTKDRVVISEHFDHLKSQLIRDSVVVLILTQIILLLLLFLRILYSYSFVYTILGLVPPAVYFFGLSRLQKRSLLKTIAANEKEVGNGVISDVQHVFNNTGDSGCSAPKFQEDLLQTEGIFPFVNSMFKASPSYLVTADGELLIIPVEIWNNLKLKKGDMIQWEKPHNHSSILLSCQKIKT